MHQTYAPCLPPTQPKHFPNQSAQLDALVRATEVTGTEATIDKPVHRTTSFVPRLGKRVLALADGPYENTPQLERLLCAFYGARCRMVAPLSVDQSEAGEGSNGRAVSRLIGNLIQGIPTQEGILRLEPTETSHDPLVFERELSLLDQQEKRQSGAELEEPSFVGGTGTGGYGLDLKRKAFTPRIGRK